MVKKIGHDMHTEQNRMKFLITGSSGLIGSALVAYLTNAGHDVRRLVRRAPLGRDLYWNPEEGLIDLSGLGKIDAVVHLAGENLAAWRWTEAKKARIANSRIESTRLLAKALAELDHKPKVLVSASAIGFYGHRGNELVDEKSGAGKGFLASLVSKWEQAAYPATEAGIRVVNLRTGMVLSGSGGALKKMLLPFKMGLGGVTGSGKQYISWVAIDDVVRIIYYAITTESISGPINVISPNPATNRQFTKTLGCVLRRPTIFKLPEFAVRLIFGEMANELLLASIRAYPNKLITAGYDFQYPELEPALIHIVSR